MPEPTPGQTVGPFFHDALPVEGGDRLVPGGSPGAVRLHGRVLDGRGDPVPDALLEIWQADPAGRVAQEHGSLRRDRVDAGVFTGFGRAATDADGAYVFTTLEPGATAPGAAPFVAMTVFARGLLDRLFTRVYLPDDVALAADPFLGMLSPEERSTLVARREHDGSLRFDVRLQGDGETVFLRFPRGSR
ncbi:protocatechuate 3,4-dioxygenase subunit alpha [Lapillicoccus jejuensis]|uniref:Protocatechuate 3,4-dioxygenase alpha subunit n=1 Tax=Lapillicoccus jejuensis TaxID=402171 RepID=A0A542E3N3_9MICO|nr:protocatechuate 3,4-dioxygenase subunit alpha [Lapillicoccus jejuensis]TQJ09950.1 protocatechuate 3,4-dioxygenase alpha subunit [Lapillicoccus jejuensis]